MVIDTEKLQTLLAILRAAGASRYKCEDFEVEFPAPPPITFTGMNTAGNTIGLARSGVAPHGPVDVTDGYHQLFHGQKPSFGNE